MWNLHLNSHVKTKILKAIDGKEPALFKVTQNGCIVYCGGIITLWNNQHVSEISVVATLESEG